MVETLLPFFCFEEATQSAKTYQFSENNMPCIIMPPLITLKIQTASVILGS